ncbi:MAG: AmmeMemoRadiSam system protein B [Thermoproteota archaeon]
MGIRAGRVIGDRRLPAVAGIFYESREEALRAQIEWAFRHPIGPGALPSTSEERVRATNAYVSPHAGYPYSGPVAAHVYYNVAKEGLADTYVIIGPNHTGLGDRVSVYPRGRWVTPLGEVEVDGELATQLVKESAYASPDEVAHLYEHSVEVQVPFLQYIFGSKVRILPVVVYEQTLEVARDLAHAINAAAEKLGRDAVVIASSDFTHYEPHEKAVEKDSIAIEHIKRLDSEGLYKAIAKYNITMCGPAPVMAAIEYNKLRGGSVGELLKYATSGDTSGEKSSVVGYAAIRLY